MSNKDRTIFDFAFERLGSNDVPTNRFDGWILGNIYPKFRSGFCMAVEIINYTNHMDPPDCNNRVLVLHRPTADQSYIFWTSNSNSTVFRVLWKNQEIGRCFIANHKCDVYLPPDVKGNK